MILEVQQAGLQLHVFTTEKSEVILGRGSEADFSINSEDVSRVHCVIKEIDGKFYVKDLKSSNGTFVYDEKIRPGEFAEFLTEFPILLGKSIQVFVRHSEPVSDVDEYGQEKKKKKVNPNADTRIFTGLLKKNILKDNYKSPKSNKKINFKFLIPVYILALGIIFYYVTKKSPEPQTVTEVPVQAVVEEINPKLVGMPKSGCVYDDEKHVCQNLGLAEGDYATYSNGELVLVINMGRMFANSSPGLTVLPEAIRKRYLQISLVNKMHSMTDTIQFKPELQIIKLYSLSSDYKNLDSLMTYTLKDTPPAAEQTEALNIVLTSGSMDEFETKYGGFYRTTN